MKTEWQLFGSKLPELGMYLTVDADGIVRHLGKLNRIGPADAGCVLLDCDNAVGAAAKLSYRWRETLPEDR